MDDYPFKCNYMSVKEIRTITDSIRNNCCGKNDLPIDVERIIEKHFHLDIILQSGIKEATGFEAFLRSDLTGIFVDSEQYLSSEEWSSNRIRFSLAHEIGHYILHDRISLLSQR
jgi:hypothetical protein